MKRQICIGLVMFAVLMILGVSLSLAQGRQEQADRRAVSASATSPAWAPWIIEQVHSTNIVAHVSVAVDPQTGIEYVAFAGESDSGSGIRVAEHVPGQPYAVPASRTASAMARIPGAGCGPDGSWTCAVVEWSSSSGFGEFNSIAIFPGTTEFNLWRLGIAYYDSENYALKFAEYRYEALPTPGYEWVISTIDTGNSVNKVGSFTSVKYTSSGVAHIAYYRSSLLTDDALKHAYQVGSGGNCGPSNAWQCDTVDTGEGMGQYASLDLDSTDRPWIAYYDDTAGLLRIASYSGSTWDFWRGPVDQAFHTTGKHVSLVLDDDDYPHLAYLNMTDGTLAYAEWVGSGGDCGYDSFNGYKWECSDIEEMGTPSSYRPVSIALDEAGFPIIAYQDASVGVVPATLKVARPIYAFGPPIPYPGNCGPGPSWLCSTIDDGGIGITEAGCVSLAVSPGGLATIAYHENRFALPDSTFSLKVAYQRWLVYLPLVLKD